MLLEGFLKCLSTDCFALTHKKNELNPKPDSVVHVDDPFVRSFVSEASLPDTPGSCFSLTSPPGSCYVRLMDPVTPKSSPWTSDTSEGWQRSIGHVSWWIER